ncbi:MAG: hypothetical protein V8T86_08705 [Victivallis sp.]
MHRFDKSRSGRGRAADYPGRALFNSISLEEERIDTILPIAAKYGAMLVLLPLTEEGIPATAADRLSVLGRIVEHAKSGQQFASSDAMVNHGHSASPRCGLADSTEKCWRREPATWLPNGL